MSILNLSDDELPIIATYCIAEDEAPYFALVCKRFRVAERTASERPKYAYRKAHIYTVFRSESRARWACDTTLLGIQHFTAFHETQTCLFNDRFSQIPVKRPYHVLWAMDFHDFDFFEHKHMPRFRFSDRSTLLRQIADQPHLRAGHEKFFQEEVDKFDNQLTCHQKKQDWFREYMNRAIYGGNFELFLLLARMKQTAFDIDLWKVLDPYEFQGLDAPSWGQAGASQATVWLELVLLRKRRHPTVLLERLISFLDDCWTSFWVDELDASRHVPFVNPRMFRVLACNLLLREGLNHNDDSLMNLALNYRMTLNDQRFCPAGSRPNGSKPIDWTRLNQEAWQISQDIKPKEDWMSYLRFLRLQELKASQFAQIVTGQREFRPFGFGLGTYRNGFSRHSNIEHYFYSVSMQYKDFPFHFFDRSNLSAAPLPLRNALINAETSCAGLQYFIKEMGVGGEFPLCWTEHRRSIELQQIPLPSWGKVHILEVQNETVRRKLRVDIEHVEARFQNLYKSEYIDNHDFFPHDKYETIRFCIAHLLTWDACGWRFSDDDAVGRAARFNPLLVYAAFKEGMANVRQWPEELRERAREGVRAALWMNMCVQLFVLLVYNQHFAEALDMARHFSMEGINVFPWRLKPESQTTSMKHAVLAYGNGELYDLVCGTLTEDFGYEPPNTNDLNAIIASDNLLLARERLGKWLPLSRTFGTLELVGLKVQSREMASVLLTLPLWHLTAGSRTHRWLQMVSEHGFPTQGNRVLPESLRPDMLTTEQRAVAGYHPELCKLMLATPYLGKLLRS